MLQLALSSVEKGLSLAYYINCLEQWGTTTAGLQITFRLRSTYYY